MEHKNSNIFSSMRNEIKEIFTSNEEIEKVLELLKIAEEESNKKEIVLTRNPNNFHKIFTLWRNRFHYGIHWKKPLYPLRVLRNMILSLIYDTFSMNKYTLRGVSFSPTYRCNFNCNHCLCAKLEKSESRKEMEPEDYKRIVKEVMDLGGMAFDIGGGEPFVSPIWEDVVKACRPKYNYVYISSNGFLFNEERANRCAELGVSTIYFSIDAGYPELHDLFRRRKGSFSRIMNAIKLCRKYGLKIIINTVVHKGNLYTEHLREILEFGEKNKILVNTKLAKAIGNFEGKDIMLDKDDHMAFAEITRPYNYAQRHLDNNYGKKTSCPGTKENMIISPYGDVFHCAEMHVILGNVMEESLKAIRERALRETPFGNYGSCFLTENKTFMDIYYNKMKADTQFPMKELKDAMISYERDHNITLDMTSFK